MWLPHILRFVINTVYLCAYLPGMAVCSCLSLLRKKMARGVALHSLGSISSTTRRPKRIFHKEAIPFPDAGFLGRVLKMDSLCLYLETLLLKAKFLVDIYSFSTLKMIQCSGLLPLLLLRWPVDSSCRGKDAALKVQPFVLTLRIFSDVSVSGFVPSALFKTYSSVMGYRAWCCASQGLWQYWGSRLLVGWGGSMRHH